MKKLRNDAPTVWKKFECGAGARWLSTYEDYAGKVCCFSGCNCGTLVKQVGETTDREEAAKWFRRPLAEPTAESKAFEAMFE